MITIPTRPALGMALLLSGVLIFADPGALAVCGSVATIVLLLVIGFRENALAAALWAFAPVLSAVIADVLWQVNWEPFNRSDEYEAIPQTPFALIAVPIPMAMILVGVGAARIVGRPRGGDRAS